MYSPIRRPAASASATARFVARAYLASPSCQIAGSKRSAQVAGGSSTPIGCAGLAKVLIAVVLQHPMLGERHGFLSVLQARNSSVTSAVVWGRRRKPAILPLH